MPTSTLGVIISGEQLAQIFGVINATLGDFKVLFYMLMGWLIGFWVIQFIISLVSLKKRERNLEKMKKDDANNYYGDTNYPGYADDEYWDDIDEDEDEDEE
jgi:hypothetical protein